MTTITTRNGKGSPLTSDELDTNFVNLNKDKVDKSQVQSAVPLNAKFTDTDTVFNSVEIEKAVALNTLKVSNVVQDLSSYATQVELAKAISDLVDSAPAAMDTLKEFAEALGDDPNFATTIATSIGNKVNNSRVLKDVPADAKFTDTNTVYTHPTTHPASMLTGALPAIDGSALTGVTPTKLTVDALGINATHVSGFTVGKSVPANAVFTDTDTDTNTWRGISDSVSTTNSAISASQTAVKAAYDNVPTHTHSYQAADGDLLAIGGLTGTSGYLKKTAADTWTLDTSTFAASSHTHSYLPLSGGNLTGNLNISGQLKLFPPGRTPYNLPDTTVAAYSSAYNGVYSQSWLGTNVTNFKFVPGSSGDHVNIELGHSWLNGNGSFFLGKSMDGSNNRFSVGTTLGELFTVLASGEVGVGTVVPVSELQVIGTITGTAFAGDGSALTGIAHNVTTNLTASASTTQVTITSSDGTNAVIAPATTTNAGVMTKTDKIKLDGIATSANNYVLPSSVIHQTELSSSVSSTSTTVAANSAAVKAAYDRSWPNTTYSAAQMLAAVKTVDGSGSGLDADLLDGQHASYFANKNLSNVSSLPSSVVAQLKGDQGNSVKGDKGDKGDKGVPGTSIKGDKGNVGATFSKSGTTLYITT